MLDDYEDLLNTIEQETAQQNEPFASALTGVRNSQKSLTAEGGPVNQNSLHSNSKTQIASHHGSATENQGGLRQMMVRKDDEPTIDF